MQVDPQAPELASSDFYELVRATRLCVLIHDAATKNILWANPAACELLEWSVTELRPLKANHMSSSAQQYDRVLGRAWLQDAVEKGVSRTQWHYRSRSGRVIPTDAIAVRVDLAQGPAVMVQFRDIEREQQVERELRLTTSYVDALAHHTSTIAVMLDAAGGIRFATDTALNHLGAPLNEPLEPLAAYARLWLEDRPASWATASDHADPVVSVRLEVPRAEDDPVWLEGSLERLRAEPEGFLMILHDVSHRVKTAVRRERELQQENYLARYNAMGDMAMAIAHELGQPLAAAGNFLAGVRTRTRTLESSGQVPAGTTEWLAYGLDAADRQIERAATIVSSVRAFVGHLEHVSTSVDLNEVVAECLYFVRLRAAPVDVRIETDLDPRPVRVRCERVLTAQVLLNLCFNAVDELSECSVADRVVRVSTRRDVRDGAATGVVLVDDHGRGLQRDPFAESFTSKEHGSGIGLALSYRIITRQHGDIWAEGRSGGGTRFGFALPAARD